MLLKEASVRPTSSRPRTAVGASYPARKLPARLRSGLEARVSGALSDTARKSLGWNVQSKGETREMGSCCKWGLT